MTAITTDSPAFMAMERRWSLDGGVWTAECNGLRIRDAHGWSSAVTDLAPEIVAPRSNFLIDVLIEGHAAAGGISFGPWKDFLCSITPDDGARRLQLDVDDVAGTWRFRCDGVIVPCGNGQSEVKSVSDLTHGQLTLKTLDAADLSFRDLSVRSLSSTCRLTVILTCWRFAQRLRVALRNWCRQSLPAGALEVIVVNPASPDGTHEVVAAMAGAFPQVRVSELAVDGGVARNKGFMINRAAEHARGEWIWLTDADCVHAIDAAARVLEFVDRKDAIFFGKRRQLGRAETDAAIAGAVDTVADFDLLARDAVVIDDFPWGYSQIMHSSVLRRVPYREHLNRFDDSDGAFLAACKKRGMSQIHVDGLSCLHLAHPFAWFGTDRYL